MAEPSQHAADPVGGPWPEESWEAYARRLELRIKEQREALNRLQELRKRHGNIRARKRNDRLQHALGGLALRLEEEKANREAIQARLNEALFALGAEAHG